MLGFRRGWRALGDDLGAQPPSSGSLAHHPGGSSASGSLCKRCTSARRRRRYAALAPHSAVEMLLWIALSFSAGFCRGIRLSRLFSAAVHRPLARVAGSASSLPRSSSACVHAYEGAAGMIAIAAYGALFCGLALLREQLRPGMIAHAWHDIFSGTCSRSLRSFSILSENALRGSDDARDAERAKSLLRKMQFFP